MAVMTKLERRRHGIEDDYNLRDHRREPGMSDAVRRLWYACFKPARCTSIVAWISRNNDLKERG